MQEHLPPTYPSNISALVTGGTGLVGAHLIKALLKKGIAVKALYRGQLPQPGIAGVQWVNGNILDILTLEDAMQQVHHVYHCAGMVSFHPSDEEQLMKMNAEGTANVVNAALGAGVQKLCFVSSVAALGKLRHGQVINETMHWTEETGNSTYGKSKFMAEMEVWRGIGEGLNAVIVNPSIILGAGNWDTGSTKLFQSAYNEFPWYTEGVSGFVDVSDVVKAMIMLMESDITTQRFILNAEHYTYKKLFTEIATCFGKRPPHKKVTPFIASMVWRAEAVKAFITGKKPLLTKETASTAQSVVKYDNSKLLQYLPTFTYTSLAESIASICKSLQQQYKLNV